MNDFGNFEEKYIESFLKVSKIDYLKKVELLGINRKGDSLIFDFYDRKLIFNEKGINDSGGLPLTFAVRTVLCKYILICQESLSESSGKLVTLREISNSGPLFSNVVTNTGKIIETTFSGNLDRLKKRCHKLCGTFLENDSYDISVKFKPLSRVPIIMNFNDQDEMMPANAVFLFQENAENYLDLESLSILCTYLTGQLIL